MPAVDVERRPALRLELCVGHYKFGPVDRIRTVASRTSTRFRPSRDMSASLLTPYARDTRRTVSQENVEIVQRYLDHWNETGDLLWAEIDPEAVFVIDQVPLWRTPIGGTNGSRTS